MEKVRFLAFYLPQFHPIKENDQWWGPGFTEWTNVVKAKPLFRGHIQPRIPANLGFYDLRLPETREQQAELAKEAGIEGFCYYHYWFGNGRQLLERPFEEVLQTKKPDYPFCLCWANHSWESKTWTNAKRKVAGTMIMKQEYPGEQDNLDHFMYLLSAFKDPRYIKVDRKPLFVIYDPFGFENVTSFIEQWRKLAKENGLIDFHFVAIVQTVTMQIAVEAKNNKDKWDELIAARVNQALDFGFDAVTTDNRNGAQILSRGVLNTALHSFCSQKLGFDFAHKFKQETINENWFLKVDAMENVYPSILPNWDRTPRSKSDSIYVDSTPDVFYDFARKAIELVNNKESDHRIVFLKSWNEWGEGNYMEPDQQYGDGYIKALAKACKGL